MGANRKHGPNVLDHKDLPEYLLHLVHEPNDPVVLVHEIPNALDEGLGVQLVVPVELEELQGHGFTLEVLEEGDNVKGTANEHGADGDNRLDVWDCGRNDEPVDQGKGCGILAVKGQPETKMNFLSFFCI